MGTVKPMLIQYRVHLILGGQTTFYDLLKMVKNALRSVKQYVLQQLQHAEREQVGRVNFGATKGILQGKCSSDKVQISQLKTTSCRKAHINTMCVLTDN